MNRNEVKTKYLYAIIACLVAVICLIPAVSAFFTDHAVLSAQIKTGTWNYSLAIDPKGGTWNGTTSATLMENLEAGQTVAIADPVRTGYTFTNWTLSAGSAGKFDSAKKIYTAAPGSKDTLSANWRANTYKIAFNGNGADGGSMPAQALTYDSKTALSVNAFTRTGYSFSGWNTSADGKGTAYADKAQISNLSAKDGDTVPLYAQWSAITYHIAYDLNGGTGAGDNPATYTVKSSAITLTAPTRTGYTFTGWTGANGTTPQTDVTIPSGSTGDRTYTANWKANTDTKYKVIHQQEQLDGSYKTVDTQNLTGTTDSKVTPAVKAYTGFTAPAAQTVTIAGAGTTTIAYKYSRNSYTITRQYRLENADGSFASYQRIDSKSYKYGASVPAWNRAADTTYKAATIAAYTVGAKNDTLSVSVMRNTSTNNIIQYRLQNADGSYPSEYTSGWSGTLRYGESYTWTYNQTASHQAVSKSVSYNAGTAKVDVPRRTGRLVIHANGGNSDRTTAPIIYGNATDRIDPMPARTGYTLTGLYTAASGGTKVADASGRPANDGTYSKSGAWLLNSDVPVYAQWKANSYTVTYNGNGASSGSMASQTATYASDFITAENAFTRTGYTFNGWNEKADGSGTPWTLTSSGVAESGKKWKWTYTNNITLFAQWTANKYTVSFNANGGTGTVSSVTATYDSALPGITNSMSRTGYTFAGFYDAATGGTQYYNASNVAVKTWNKAANTTLYAHWTLTPYKFDVNPQSHVTGFKLKKNGADVSGGSTLTDYYQDAYMGDVFTVHSPTFAAGYTFAGYTKQEGSGAQTVSGTTATVTMGAGLQSIAIMAKPITYSIGYNLNGGTVSGQKTSYTIESDAFTLPTPSKNGWTFTGWSGTGLSGNANKTVTVAKGSTGNRSYTAHFSKTITLTQKHGTSTTTQTYALTDSVTSHTFTLASTKDSYDGWTFIGWRDSATPGPKQYDPTGTITLSADHTVYATYSQTQTLTFVDYNGTTKQTRTVTGTAYGNNSAGGVANQYPTLTAPSESTYTGWASRGWSTSTTSNANVAVASGGTIANATTATYYGLYQQNVKLTYNANGGSSTPAAQTGVRYANSSSISAYTNPSFTLAAGITRTGYTFAGWSVSAPIGAVKAANTAIVPASGTALTATAQWTANNYTVTYEDWFVDKNNARKLKLGSTTKAKPYDSTVNGNELGADGSRGKYYTDYVYKSSTSAKVTTSGATVYRYFWAYTDLNIFYADGSTQGGGTVGLSMDGNNYTDVDNEGASNTVQPYGTTYYIKNIRPKHSYETLDRVENLTLSNGVYTYTPVKAGTSMGIWMKYITYSISYNLNGGTVSGNPTSYNYGTASFTLKNPTKTGYSFTGWTGSNGTTAQTAVTVAKGSYGNKSYTANWTANTNTKYTVIHQQEQLDGTYKTVETQNLTGTTDAKVTPAVKSYTGFTAPSTQTITIAANGSASVTYKYTRNSYTITRQYRYENPNGTFTDYTQIDSKSYKYGATVAAWSRAADTTYKAASIAAHAVGAKNETLSVNVMRNTSTNNVIQYRLQNADGSYPSAYTTGWSGTLRYDESHTWSLAQTVSHAAASKSVSYNGGTLKVDVPRRTGRLVINANGGSFSGSASRTTSAIRYGSTGDNISPMPTRTGYTLNGLYTAASGGTKVVNADGTKANDGTYSKNGAWQLNSDVTVYAQWTANKYTVTLSKGQGIDSVSGAGTYTYGQTVTIDATVNTNYNWSQWNVLSGTVSGTLTNKKLTFTMPAGNVSLRAGDASGNEAHRKTYVITYHANLHDGQKLQDSDGTGSTDTHISSVPSGAVKGTSGGIEVYQQTILSGGGSKVLANGFSWTAVKAAAAKVMSTLFDTNWD